MSERMDIHRTYQVLGSDAKNADYCRQDGIIYAWSESNIGYERCWWLTAEGDPVRNAQGQITEHVANLLKDRPFNKAWLK